MTVIKAISYIDSIINKTLADYEKTDDAYKQENYNTVYVNHILDELTEEDRLMAIDMALKNVALNTTPLSLLETVGSSATVFKRISVSEFVRAPEEPTIDGSLDIDDGLSFAVIYKALSIIWSGYSSYSSDSDSICATYDDALRDYFLTRETDTEYASNVLFRFSSDNIDFHDNYIDGDIYISFKNGTDGWSTGIKFVGEDGATGEATGEATASATTFVELTDTPSTLTAGKWLKVNDAGNAIEEADAPEATATLEGMNGVNGISGAVVLDMRQGHGNTSSSYLVLNGDLTLDFTQTDGYYDLDAGVVYNIEILPEGYNCSLLFTARGNKVIDSTSFANVIQLMYDGDDILILNNIAFPN